MYGCAWAPKEEKAESAEAAAALRGTLRARDAELAAMQGDVAASVAARQAAADAASSGRVELNALRAELDKVGTAAPHMPESKRLLLL